MPERLVVIASPFLEQERVETRLIQDDLSPESAVRLAEAFLDDTLTLAHHPALRADCWFAYTGDVAALSSMTMGVWRIPQRGHTEDERLAHILKEGAAAGFHSICVIGTEMPHLPVAFIQEAFGRLAFGADAVYGPTEAGGCYLIGLRASRGELFENIPWSTDTVLQHLLMQAEKRERSVALLPAGYTMTSSQEVQRLKRDLTRGVAYAPVTASALAAKML